MKHPLRRFASSPSLAGGGRILWTAEGRRGAPVDSLGSCPFALVEEESMAAGLVGLLDDVAALAKLAAASIDDVGAAAGVLQPLDPTRSILLSTSSTGERSPLRISSARPTASCAGEFAHPANLTDAAQPCGT